MPAPKSPIQHALDTLVAKEEQQKMLRLLHALVTTSWSRSAVESGKSNEDLAAESRMFARQTIEIETLLHEVPNPFVTPKSGAPIPLSPAEFDRHRSQQTNQPTS